MVTPVNKKYQSLVNRFIKADTKYNSIVDKTDDNGGLAQEKAYDKACELFEQLPKRERLNLSKHVDIRGY